jgi:glycosyltransferase involved in cell wall biosynthesis
MKPKLTIVTASYNKPDLLRECAQSVFAQTDPSWEWMLVLDGPDQATREVACEILRDHRSETRQSQVAVINLGTTEEQRRERYQPAVITNSCFDQAQGEYVVWLSDDDLLMPRFVEAMTSTGAPAAYCSVERRALTPEGKWVTTNYNPAREPWVYGSSDGGSMVLSKRAWDELGWREPTGWDTASDLDQRLMQAVNDKHPLRAVPEVLMVHRSTKQSTHQSWRQGMWRWLEGRK